MNVIRAAACLAAGYVWSAVASAIYCLGTGNLAQLSPPYLEWWQVLPYWAANWWVTTWFVSAAAIPTLVLLAIAVRFLRRRDEPPLYGRSEWARGRHLAPSFRQTRSPL
jgi:hypothetical protein